MSLLCSTNCGSIVSPPKSFLDACQSVEPSVFAFEGFGLIQCDVTFVDITDPAEWQTYIDAGQICLSPPGDLQIPKPTFETVRQNGCGGKIVMPAVVQANYTSFATTGDSQDDVYWKNFWNNRDSYKVFFVDCEGKFYFDQGWFEAIQAGSPATIAGESPGYDFSVTERPHPEPETIGDKDYKKWGVQFEFNSDTVFCGIKIPGIASLLV